MMSNRSMLYTISSVLVVCWLLEWVGLLSLLLWGSVCCAYVAFKPEGRRPLPKFMADRMKSCRVIGHRGSSDRAPENTLAAIRRCKDVGCSGVEIDLGFTKDGVAVLMHDASLDRTCGTKDVLMHTLTYAETQKYDAAATCEGWKRSERIPRLTEVLDLAFDESDGQSPLIVYLDCKLVDSQLLIALLKSLQKSHPGIEDRMMVCSFYPHLLYLVRRHCPAFTTGYTYRQDCITEHDDRSPRGWPVHLRVMYTLVDAVNHFMFHGPLPEFLGVSAVLMFKDEINKRLVEIWREQGVEVLLWTVNCPTEKRFFVEKLEACVMTDHFNTELVRNIDDKKQ